MRTTGKGPGAVSLSDFSGPSSSRLGFLARLFRIKAIRFDRRIESESLCLRLPKFKDFSVLGLRLGADPIPRKGTRKISPYHSLLLCRRWLRSPFQAFYLIEAKGRKDPLIGFVGIYHLEIGRRLYLSAALFDPADRRRGYSRQALTLLFHSLNRVGLAEEVRAEVLRSNADSLAFFRTMGFSLLADQGDRLLLTRTLAGCHNHIEAKPEMSAGELSRER